MALDNEKKTFLKTDTPSMRDIARRLGISVASVSRALNNQPGVGEDLRRRVLEEAMQRAYVLNSPVAPTPSKETQVIAFLLHHRVGGFAQDPFYPAILHGLEQEAASAGYHVLLHSTSLEEEQQFSQLAIFSKRLADGCVIAGPDISQQFITDLWRVRFPFILVDNYLEHIGVDSVETDNIGGAYNLTQHLIQHHDYRDIVFVHSSLREASIHDRYIGYKLAMEDAGLAPREAGSENGIGSGEQTMRHLLAHGAPPRAVFVSNDKEALGALQVIRAAGLRVPEDIALVGYDDIPPARIADPALTTIHVHTEQMGREAARRLLVRIRAQQDEQGGESAPTPIRIHVRNELVIRQSCGCP